MPTRFARAAPVRIQPVTPARARPSAGQVVGGLGALAVLLVGLVGIPLALATFVGWPLPHHVPSGAAAAHALGSSIPDSFWPRLFATLAWAAWAWFVVAVAASVVDRIRGRRPGRRRLLVGSGAAAALVAAVLLLGQLRPTPTAHSAGPVVPAGRAPVVQLVADTSTTTVPILATTTAATPPATVPSVAVPTTVTHTVVEGDTLWSIAADYYGDGERWSTIYEANVGVTQPGGGALGDAHWIYPGWSLTIPDATQLPNAQTPVSLQTNPAPAPATTPATTPTTVPVPSAPESGSPAAGSIHQRPAADQGQEHQSGPSTGSAPADRTRHSTSPRPLRRSDSAPTRRAGLDAPATVRRRPAHSTGSEVAPIAIGAGLFGLSAIGLVAALDRRRRRQLGRRPRGGHIPRPAPTSPLAELELQLRHVARAQHAAWVCHLPELLGYATIAGAAPDVVGIELGDDGIDVLMADAAVEPVTPFSARPDRPGVWHLPLTTDPAVLDEVEDVSPFPLLLATVGRTATSTVLVNVALHRSIHVTVAQEQSEGVLNAMATELAATTAPVGTAVVAVGFGYGVVDRLPGGAVSDDLDEVQVALRSVQPTVVLVDPRSTTDEVLQTIRGAANVHLVTAGPAALPDTELTVDPEHPVLQDHRLEPLEPAQVADASLEDVQTLFEMAEEDSEVEAELPGDTAEPDRTMAVPAGEVVIGVLGEPTVQVGDGEARDLATAVSPTAGTKARRVAELLVYLAVHGGSATRGAWLTDISPDRALSDGYVRNLVLLTRRSLEAITGDSDLLAYDRATQRFSLADRVTTDWSTFQSASSVGDPTGLRTALELVRGTPFGVDPEPWTSAGGLSYVIGDAITDAALTLGDLALEDDDRTLAAWAARQGQLANRWDQGLWRLLLRAAADSARRQIWDELHALLAVDGDAADDLEPATLALYDSLGTSRRPASDVVVLQDEDDAVLPTRQAV